MLGWIVSEADTFELKQKQVKCTWVYHINLNDFCCDIVFLCVMT